MPGGAPGDFEIISFLARGGVGAVYRARQLSLAGRSVALKVLTTDQVSASDRRRFVREARIAAAVHHPHLVEVYDYGEHPERKLLYYAMRLVEGPSLQEVLVGLARDGPPSPEDRRLLVRRFLEVARRLEALHARGLVHRDVKPANIVLEGGADGRPWERAAVLVDVGLVRSALSGPTVSSLRATPSYAPREQLLGGPLDARADVFSLGVSLHDLLAGRLPRDRGRPTSEGLEPLGRVVPGVSPNLAAVVARAADPDPRWRYPDASALAADLEAWLAGEPVQARPLGPVEGLWRWTQRHPGSVLRWLVRGLAAAVVGTLVLAGGLWTRDAWTAARGAERAWDSGCIEDLHAALAELPGFLDRPLLSGELAPRADSLRRLEGEVPTIAVLRANRASGPEAGLLLAARHLEADGLGAHPFLVRCLERSLRSAGAGEDGDGLGSYAVFLAARLFLDRPDGSAVDAAWSADLRRKLLGLLFGGTRPEERYALTALSGCATLADLPRLLAWTLERSAQDVEGEGVKLAVMAMERTLRRWTGLRGAGTLEDPGPFVEGVAVLCRRSHRARTADGGAITADNWLADLLTAHVLQARSRGETVPLAAVDLGLFLPLGEAFVRAAAGDPTLGPSILGGRFRGGILTEDNRGELCGLLGDPALTEAAEAAVRREGGDPEEFRSHLARGRKRCNGTRWGFEPDPRSHLGATVGASPTVRELEVVSIDETAPLARWGFRHRRPEAAGWAEGVACTGDFAFDGGDAPETHDDHWVMRNFGGSRVTLRFSPTDRNAERLELRIEHLAASRPYVPRKGEVYLDMLLNGGPRAVSYRVDWHDPATSRLVLPPGTLRPGTNTITLHVTASTTTTYRLHAVEIGVLGEAAAGDAGAPPPDDPPESPTRAERSVDESR